MESDKRQGLVFVVSSPSGGGKTSLVNMALESLPNLKRSISCTTRSRRPGEEDGVDYTFVDRLEFQWRITQDRLLEWAEVYGNLYGTPKEAIEENRACGVDTILAIEIQGARSIRQRYSEAITIFVQPPSLEVLEQRLRKRRLDPEDAVQRRLEVALAELEWIHQYDYAIVNDELDRAFEDLKAIMTAERLRVRRNPGPLPA
ncbi:MAG: guanylate kinase [bacterium]